MTLMKKIAILTDSSSSLDFIPHSYENVFQIRLRVFFGSTEYIDGETITTKEFFRRITEEDIVPTTSQPSVGEVMEICEHIAKLGYTDVIYLPLSKGISSSYSSIMGSQDMIERINLHIVDTRSTAVYLGFMTTEAARLVKEGKDVEEVIAYMNYLSDHQHIYFMVNDLKYLVKNGRLSNASGFIANMLKIKPILVLNEEGKIVGTEKVRTTKKALQTIVGYIHKAKESHKKVQICICHGLDEALLNEFKEELTKYVPLEEMMIVPLPPVIGAHVGNGLVCIGYFVLEA